MSQRIESAKELKVYKLAYELVMQIYEATRSFPSEERFALTGQIRRSWRSVCLNLREAWAKRRYESHFVSKLTDCDGEANETDSSLDFARDCGVGRNDKKARGIRAVAISASSQDFCSLSCVLCFLR